MGHASQPVLRDAVVAVPGAHATHAELPAALCAYPGAQSEHELAAAGLDDPALHVKHAVAPQAEG